MKQARSSLVVETGGSGLSEVTRDVSDWVFGQEIDHGLLTLFVRHTSASLLIQENADPDVLADLNAFFARIAPHDGDYRHRSEGPDDMPAHIKAALTHSHLGIPVTDRRLMLGTWQGIFLFEHRDRPHRREIILHIAGE